MSGQIKSVDEVCVEFRRMIRRPIRAYVEALRHYPELKEQARQQVFKTLAEDGVLNTWESYRKQIIIDVAKELKTETWVAESLFGVFDIRREVNTVFDVQWKELCGQEPQF